MTDLNEKEGRLRKHIAPGFRDASLTFSPTFWASARYAILGGSQFFPRFIQAGMVRDSASGKRGFHTPRLDKVTRLEKQR